MNFYLKLYLRIEMMTCASLGSCFDGFVFFVFSLFCSLGRNEAIIKFYFRVKFQTKLML